jgi:hypothetical protein
LKEGDKGKHPFPVAGGLRDLEQDLIPPFFQVDGGRFPEEVVFVAEWDFIAGGGQTGVVPLWWFDGCAVDPHPGVGGVPFALEGEWPTPAACRAGPVMKSDPTSDFLAAGRPDTGAGIYRSLLLLKPGGETEEMTDMNGPSGIGATPGIFLSVDGIAFPEGILNGKFPVHIALVIKGAYDFPGDVSLFHVGKRFALKIEIPVADQPLLEGPEFIEITVFRRIAGKGQPGQKPFTIIVAIAAPGGFTIGNNARINGILADDIPFVRDVVVVPATEDPSEAEAIALRYATDPVEVKLCHTGQGIEVVEIIEAGIQIAVPGFGKAIGRPELGDGGGVVVDRLSGAPYEQLTAVFPDLADQVGQQPGCRSFVVMPYLVGPQMDPGHLLRSSQLAQLIDQL